MELLVRDEYGIWRAAPEFVLNSGDRLLDEGRTVRRSFGPCQCGGEKAAYTGVVKYASGHRPSWGICDHCGGL